MILSFSEYAEQRTKNESSMGGPYVDGQSPSPTIGRNTGRGFGPHPATSTPQSQPRQFNLKPTVGANDRDESMEARDHQLASISTLINNVQGITQAIDSNNLPFAKKKLERMAFELKQLRYSMNAENEIQRSALHSRLQSQN
jgi:hypothetical protein